MRKNFQTHGASPSGTKKHIPLAARLTGRSSSIPPKDKGTPFRKRINSIPSISRREKAGTPEDNPAQQGKLNQAPNKDLHGTKPSPQEHCQDTNLQSEENIWPHIPLTILMGFLLIMATGNPTTFLPP